MYLSSTTKAGLTIALAVVLAGCHHGPPRAPSIGEAYVGPGNLKIRSEIALQSPVVATVKHGDRLDILLVRRRFLKVRTAAGAEGWTDERQLLAASDMSYLQDLATKAAKMPAQGQGTTYIDVNVHTQPSATSPSFFQIKEKEKVDVLTHVFSSRVDAPRKPLIPPAPKKTKKSTKKAPAKEPKYPPPPMPKPPGLPENWIELSKSDRSDDDPPPVENEVEEKPAAPRDAWSLVRNREGQSGWILTRRLVMAIPDEVAQYAEGKHIVSYFALGQTQDGDLKKSSWLWTTAAKGTVDYDFDSFRVFIWSLRRHRYETAHIERNVRGYSPILIKDVEYAAASSRSEASAGKYPGFSICMENRDGQRVRREFALLSNVIRSAGEQPCEAPAPIDALKPLSGLKTAPEPPVAPPVPPFTERMKKKVKGWFGK